MAKLRYVFVLLIFLATGCKSGQDVVQSCVPHGSLGMLPPAWCTATLRGLTLNFAIKEDSAGYHIRLRTKDRVVMARIMALGLTVAFSQQGKVTHSIDYPIGAFELRSFASEREVIAFWDATNTVSTWKTKMERNKGLIRTTRTKGDKMVVKKAETHGISGEYVLDAHGFYYSLHISKAFLADMSTGQVPPSIGIVLGRLEVKNKLPRKKSFYTHPYFLSPNGWSCLSEPWEIWVDSDSDFF